MVVGDVELVPLLDAVGVPGTLAEFYPGVEPFEWRRARTQYPQLFTGDSWRLPVTCYLVGADGRTVLVDTGVGPAGLWSWQPEWEGGLLPALEGRALAPGDVDLVLITHEHIDHIGWNANEEGEPLFYRYLMHEAAVASMRKRVDEPQIQRCLLSLGDRLESFTGEVELAPGVTTVELPGHAAGHVGVRIRDDAFLIVDAVPHPLMLDRPELRFAADLDGDAAVATRQRLVGELVDRPILTVCGHYPGNGIGRALTRDGHVVWEPA